MEVPRRLSVYSENRWFFAQISSKTLAYEDSTRKYYKIDIPFGIVDVNQFDPRITMKRGKPGDFLSIDYNNVLGVVSKAQFDLLRPKQTVRNTPSGTASYKQLANKDFYGDVVRNTPG